MNSLEERIREEENRIAEIIMEGNVNTENLIETLLLAGERLTKERNPALFVRWYEQFVDAREAKEYKLNKYFYDYVDILWTYLHDILEELYAGPLAELSLSLIHFQNIHDAFLYMKDIFSDEGHVEDTVFSPEIDAMIEAVKLYIRSLESTFNQKALECYWRDTWKSEMPLILKPSWFDVE